ncbi:MAG TPA: aminoacetone oxidase family FAD-binding enzyme, partial [Bacteroidetes bacterium]|nr:aminoacetone oxidase family FAD-binding enzyme [Bacteroidota bacterium]
EVTLLERTNKAGKKILMSGGTRCNVLPVRMELSDYYTDSSVNLLKRIFKSWSLDACKDWFERDLGLKMACEVESNKWFPASNSAEEVRDVLLKKALSLGVKFVYNVPVNRIVATTDGWTVFADQGGSHSADKLIIATGGLSVPTIGTDGMGHKFLGVLDVPLRPTYPALTPLTGSHPGTENLAGISLNVQISVRNAETSAGLGQSNREGFLFTHKGFSGPAVLDVSHYATKYLTGLGPKPDYRVNWTSDDVNVWRTRMDASRSTVRNFIKDYLPNRLAEALASEHPSPDKKIAECSKVDRKVLLDLMTDYPLKWSSNEGYRKAEVTGGGVPLEAINTASMQVKDHPGLYLCGEILDVFGRIGGFNFYWAWVTGRLAGKQ